MSDLPKKLEKTIEAKLMAALESLGYVQFKFLSTVTGVPDRVVFGPGGRFYLLELKREDGKLRKRQEYIQEKLAKVGAPVRVITGEAEADAFYREVKGFCEEVKRTHEKAVYTPRLSAVCYGDDREDSRGRPILGDGPWEDSSDLGGD